MFNYIDDLTDEELEYLINLEDATLWLEPFKHGNNMVYAQYRSRLGSMKKNSPLVKAYLPGIIIKLYKKIEFHLLHKKHIRALIGYFKLKAYIDQRQ